MRRSPTIRHLLRLLCVLAVMAGSLAAVSGAAASAAPAPSPWLQPGYSAGGTYANVAETRIAKYNIGTLSSRWSAPSLTDGSCNGDLFQPALSESYVYSVRQGELTKQRIKDGSVAWTNADPLTQASDPLYLAVSTDRVVLLLQDCTARPVQQYLVAFNTATGARVWERTLPPGQSARVSTSNEYLLLSYRNNGDRSVLGIRSGTVVWHTSATDEACNSTPKVLNYQVLVEVCDATTHAGIGLRARTLATGLLVWTRSGFKNNGVIAATNDAADVGHAYVYDESLRRTVDVDPSTGATRFALVASRATGAGALAVDGTRVYASCAIRDTAVCAWDVATGKFRWQLAFADDYHVIEPTVVGSLLYLGLNRSDVIKAATGELVTTLDFRMTVGGSGHLAGYHRSAPFEFQVWATSNVA